MTSEEMLLNAMGCEAANVHLGTKSRTQKHPEGSEEAKARLAPGCGRANGEDSRKRLEALPEQMNATYIVRAAEQGSCFP
jgi:hypothetical protein